MQITMVPNDLTRAIHRSLLLSCGIAETRRFWEQNPLELNGRVLDPVALALHITDESGRSPMSWTARVLNALELFLVERGVSMEAFCSSLLTHANRSSFVSAKAILARVSPFMAQLFRISDPHRLFVRLCTVAAAQAVPELIFEELSWRRIEDNQRSALLIIGFKELWEGLIPPWDPSIFGARLLCQMPPALGLTPYEAVDVRADARGVATITGPAALEIRDGVCLIEGEPYGRAVGWNEYCTQLAVSTTPFVTPDLPVIVIERDWVCPRRGRPVLVANCAYGAPVCLLEARWHLDRRRIHAAFEHLIHEAVYGVQPPDDARASDLLHEFIADPRLPVRCTFNAREQSMYVEGECVVRGVPAIILRNCLREYCQSGRYLFAFREFKRDPQLISHPKNTGFEVRLRRLRERLEANHCPIQIQTLGRGQFALRVHRVLVLDELTETAELHSLRRAPASEGPSDPSWS